MSIHLTKAPPGSKRDVGPAPEIPGYSTDMEPAACDIPPAHPERGSSWKTYVNLLAMLALAALATGFLIDFSYYWGRLSYHIPPYDDVGYFNHALERLAAVREQGIWALVPMHFQVGTHSPWATYAALVGYCVFGTTWWAPYAMNAFVLFFALLQVHAIARSCPWWSRWGLMLVFLTLPFSLVIVENFRPDPFCVILTAAGLRKLAQTRLSDMSRNNLLGVALYWGAALLVKPTVFAQTIAFFLGALTLCCLREWWSQPRVRALVCRKSLACTAVACLVAAPHLGPKFLYYVDYMWKNTFGASRELWTFKASFFDQLTYYITGEGGVFSLGHLAPWMFGIIAITTGLAWYRRQQALGSELLALSAFTFLCWLPPTLNDCKSPFYGMAFCAMLLFTLMRALAAWLGNELQIPRRVSLAIGCALLLGLSSGWRMLKANTYREHNSGDYAHVVREVHECLRGYVNTRPGSVVVLPAVGILNGDVLRCGFFMDGSRPPECVTDYMSNDLGQHLKSLERADVVILPGADSPWIWKQFPFEEVYKDVVNHVEHDDHFQQVADIFETTKARLRIFVRRSSFEPLQPQR